MSTVDAVECAEARAEAPMVDGKKSPDGEVDVLLKDAVRKTVGEHTDAQANAQVQQYTERKAADMRSIVDRKISQIGRKSAA